MASHLSDPLASPPNTPVKDKSNGIWRTLKGTIHDDHTREDYSSQSNQSTPSNVDQSPHPGLIASSPRSVRGERGCPPIPDANDVDWIEACRLDDLKINRSTTGFVDAHEDDNRLDGYGAREPFTSWKRQILPCDSNNVPLADCIPQQDTTHNSISMENSHWQDMATVLVRVSDIKFNYQMTGKDLFKVFGRYGEVVGVSMLDGGTRALVHYSSRESAKLAHDSLNEKKLASIGGSLYVEIVSLQFNNKRNDVQLSPSHGGLSQTDIVVPSTATHDYEVEGDGDIRKFTIRYEIQIPPDTEFQVARRIIGFKGMNMKRIFKLTSSKLRLRGKGSGYLEGFAREEADEALHLCISSCDGAKYRMTCVLVEELLNKIYREFDLWLALHSRSPQRLQVKSKELFISSRGLCVEAASPRL